MRASLVGAVTLLGLSACPQVESLECKRCSRQEECSPQGLACVWGQCVGAHSECRPERNLPAPPPSSGARSIFQDDFELGALLASEGGQWDARLGSADAEAVSLASDGVGGSRALVVAYGPTNRAALFRQLRGAPTDASEASRFVRSQLRLSAGAGADADGGAGPVASVQALTVYSSAAPGAGTVLADVSLGAHATLACGRPGQTLARCEGGRWEADRWLAVDLVLENLGRAGGACSLRVDGVEQCRLAVDWSGVTEEGFSLGPAVEGPTGSGELRVDNLSLSAGAPAPGRLALAGPQSLHPFRCFPVRVELHDSFKSELSAAVRPTRLRLGGPAVAFYSDRCAELRIDELTIPAGDASAMIWVMPSTEEVTLEVEDSSGVLAPASLTWR